MKPSKIIIAVLLVSALSVPLISCHSSTDTEAESEYQLVSVQRGDLVVAAPAEADCSQPHDDRVPEASRLEVLELEPPHHEQVPVGAEQRDAEAPAIGDLASR